MSVRRLPAGAMKPDALTVPVTGECPAWGSDAIASLLHDLGIEFVALNPGASFRGLHDSLVNHLGNARPIVLALHEESAVAMAHVTRR